MVRMDFTYRVAFEQLFNNLSNNLSNYLKEMRLKERK